MRQRFHAILIAAVSAAVMFAVPARATDDTAEKPLAVANVPDALNPQGPVIQPLRGNPEKTPADAHREGGDTSFTIVLGGDVGLGGSNEPVHPDGAFRHGTRHRWADLSAGIAPLINGDINFANLETVVTDRNDLRPTPKAFNFRGHPDGVRHLAGLGFNAFSTANNHAMDFGEAGSRATLKGLEALQAYGLKAWPGVGLNREHASRPADIAVKGTRVRLSAIGIGGHGMPDGGNETGQRAGMLAYNTAADFNETVSRLAAAEGDLRILSVHYGRELQVRPDSSDVVKLRDEAVKGAGIDIVAGHHAHVAAGVQIIGGKLVFYGLGNLLHPGMQDMARFNVCRDYGLMARLHYARGTAGRLELRAIEAIPLADMHERARAMPGEGGRARVEVLNHHASGLDDGASGAKGVRFTGQPDGSGLYCLPGAADEPGRIGALCRDWKAPEPPSATLSRRLANACGTPDYIARRRSPGQIETTERLSGSKSARRLARQSGAKSASVWNPFGGW